MFYSPLRYPGGKGKLAPFMKLLIYRTNNTNGTYIEPFAGGAGIALDLLENNIVNNIVINDLDKGIYSFWRAILYETDKFIDMIDNVEISIDEWYRQRNIMLHSDKRYSLELGFATFYMNRTNRSGIIRGGVIGGVEQTGLWKMDVRFNKQDLVKRIYRIAERRRDIYLYNKDVISFIKHYLPKYKYKAFVYFDPPYYSKGKQLYLNFFEKNDHIRIERNIREIVDCNWIITYDNVSEIEDIYKDYSLRHFDLNYSTAEKRRASEIIIFSHEDMIIDNSMLEKEKIYINLR